MYRSSIVLLPFATTALFLYYVYHNPTYVICDIVSRFYIVLVVAAFQKVFWNVVLNFEVTVLVEYIGVCIYSLRLSSCRGGNFICHNEWMCWGECTAIKLLLP